jgi:hypothetical protein
MSALSLAPATIGLSWPGAARTTTATPRRAEPRVEAPEFGLALCVAGPASPAELAALAALGRGLLRRLGSLAARVTGPLPPGGRL